MQIIDIPEKKLMEQCKEKARAAGLNFRDDTLEYVVTNREFTKMMPKSGISTLYDYWVHDVDILKGEGEYQVFPHNPYEMVVNTNPAISFYNDNNREWMNVMIFYHVLGHIDFMQNNQLFKKTWVDDFAGKALSDKRLIAKLRSEKGRWVDYVIEFTRGIDNIVGFFDDSVSAHVSDPLQLSDRLNYYFNDFLPKATEGRQADSLKEIERYNQLKEIDPNLADNIFFSGEVQEKYPEFEEFFQKHQEEKKEQGPPPKDLIEFIMQNSPNLRKKENQWMRQVMDVVRDTSLYFSPQIRSKVMNEGWASYWHDDLFRKDELIKGQEVDYAILNAGVTALRQGQLNPYAIGLRLFQYVEELADKGKLGHNFQRIQDREERKDYDLKTGKGKEFIFRIREEMNDFNFINTFVDQDFVDKHKLFVMGRRLNPEKRVIEYYIKSKKAEDYKQMLIDTLYHPPYIKINQEKTSDDNLYLEHQFEEKILVPQFIPHTMRGIEFLWGNQVQLETTEVVPKDDNPQKTYYGMPFPFNEEPETIQQRVRYTMKDKKINKEVIK